MLVHVRATAWTVVQGHPNQAHGSLSMCGDDAYALGWGVLTTQVMVGAKAAPQYDCSETQK